MVPARRRVIRRRTGHSRQSHAGSGNPLLARILGNRNLAMETAENYSLDQLADPELLKDGEKASALLVAALGRQDHILIVGDYDADGATATVLGKLAMEDMGFRNVSYLVPNRFEFGYGLSPEIARVALQQDPDIVITVDNGISSVEGANIIKQAGKILIITDHHLPGDALPAADAILNPNQPECGFPEKTIAGVGVMFYLMLLLRKALRDGNWFSQAGITEPNLSKYLDLVALGTVADVVPMAYNNRILVARGLEHIRKGMCRPGILALLEISGRNYRTAVTSDIGFVVAPRLNAAGRLEDISVGIECLLAGQGKAARKFAGILDGINSQRKEIEQEMQQQAMEIVRDLGRTEKEDGYAISLYRPDWHQGITGLVASRVREQTGRPVAVFAKTESGQLTGSCRSVPGFHIKDALDDIAASSPGLMQKYGGHAMAAGLTILEDNLEQFGLLFDGRARVHYHTQGDADELWSDGDLAFNELSLENAEALRYGAPWGQGFPAPMFDSVFDVVDSRVVGDRHLKFVLSLPDGSREYDAIAFSSIEPGEGPPQLGRIHALYQLDANEYRGKKRLQLVLEYFEVVG